ncbi:peptidoglycan/xylan/chitin deacetylase (PgdA/CDA1 family) [Paraburkholderia sp. BL6669N2]|uniref:polysaccharide deacetylase family protein n=1 Tax=Paraburkholderia sp. BL6669N2 TaxID=1938807 RepID=UPI000E3A2F78|nr:polysaccharide deacetylase family protein [Paraburkholderia sp. BL6669N2]REG51036.1 peptidoglycan/xylan/chitin deacetylase (PgdA/CDA1 family) [Paraburkholderia sp. BL6669N2]
MALFESRAWGPQRRRACVCVTFDNLGEACDINMGRWPAANAVGRHFTATHVLPKLLEDLDGLRITYFIESVNALRYPEQMRAVKSAGHEVGWHTWGHENWSRMSLDEKRSNLEKSLAMLRTIDIFPVGFRPPGGLADAPSMALLRQHGFTYCSPVSSDPSVHLEEELTVLPFAWRYVDAYLIDPDLGDFRVAHGDMARPATATEWERILNDGFDAAHANGEQLTVIFHPYLFGADERLWQVMRRFLVRLKARDDVWLATCSELAEWVASSVANRTIA